MNAFYNPEGVGDTLLISLNDIPREEIAFERCGDVVKIFHKDTKETAGYNRIAYAFWIIKCVHEKNSFLSFLFRAVFSQNKDRFKLSILIKERKRSDRHCSVSRRDRF